MLKKEVFFKGKTQTEGFLRNYMANHHNGRASGQYVHKILYFYGVKNKNNYAKMLSIYIKRLKINFDLKNYRKMLIDFNYFINDLIDFYNGKPSMDKMNYQFLKSDYDEIINKANLSLV